jgi:hypothetical protein
MIEEIRERVVPGAIRELGGRTVEVRDHALSDERVDHGVEPLLECEHVFGGELRTALADESPEHPPKQLELGDDVPRCEPERLAFARVIADERRERAAPVQPFRLRMCEMRRKLRDERRHVA